MHLYSDMYAVFCQQRDLRISKDRRVLVPSILKSLTVSETMHSDGFSRMARCRDALSAIDRQGNQHLYCCFVCNA
jgi:hypothetical protein